MMVFDTFHHTKIVRFGTLIKLGEGGEGGVPQMGQQMTADIQIENMCLGMTFQLSQTAII